MTGVEDGKGSGGGEGIDVSATDKVGQQNGAPEKAPVVAGTNMETLPRPGKQSDPSTAFLRAARAGQLEKVLEFLESGVDINASNANGLNALHLAAKDGHLEIVRELLTRGATVDAATKKGNTALHIASLAGQEEVVQLLVQKGASVNAQSQNGFTPLYMAAQENHDSVVKFLLSKGANQTLATEDGFTPLAVAMQQGHDKVVAVLLESDTRGKVRLPALHIAAKKDDCKAAALLLQNDHNPDVTSKSGFTPLHIAAHYGNDRIASLLYEKGADVNFAAKHNITPMHVAAKWGKIKMVNLLMSKGANISAKTRDGLTPLHCAARAGHHEVVDILIEKGAPIGSKTKNGLAPLHMASQGDHVDAARILLYHRAPVDEVTVDYLTALHVAAHCGHVRVAKLLLDRNADPNARALNGFTPLHIACKKNRIKVVELLLKHKASIEATTESGLTPLHVASFMGCMNIVIYLLQNEASPDIPTVRGETPLHLAARANQTDIIRILLRNGAQVDARAREEQTPLHVASRLGNVDIVMLLLQHGADVDATTKDLYTPLHIAAKEGQEEVASVLLDNGASLTATTKKGFTPLHLAAKYGNMNVARLLLQKNAPVDAQGKNGVTPLHVASHYDHQNVALLLLDKGASPHAMAKNGHTPLHIAARKNQMDIATTLLEYGAKANAESKAGFTPLHLSAQEGHTDMSTLLIEHKADTNHRAKNGLTPLHLCAQEDKTNVATILVKNGAQVDAKTKAGYTPLHVASHFGQAAMVRFLLRNGAAVDSGTGAGYTPLHQAAQQGHTLIINLLLESKAKPNAVTHNGQTALAIAQKLGYISVVETLKIVTETVITTTHTITIEEKYKVQAPESMQETFMSDSEDEGGEDPMLSDQQQYRYMTVDDMKSMGDDSMRVNVTDDEKDNRHSGGVCVTDMVTKEAYQLTHATTLKPDNVDIHRHPIHVGFLVSFLVDARGGAMRGCRHSGVRVIVPPRKAAMPMRVTCRYLKRDKLTNPPPLMEGEALASRILELGPVGAKFLGPVIIEVPHFASLRGKEREIVILRSDNGETWREHTLEASEEAVQDVLNESFEGEELSQLEDLQTSRIVRVLTVDFPHYFAVVSRIRQEVNAVGPEGGTVSSSAVPQVQAVFPPAALTKKIRVGLQAHPIPVELVAKLLGNRVAVSPIVTVEPRRRKFHKPITLTIPVPQAANKGMINQYSGETPTLRLLCSITGGQSRAVWEDVTGSTPLQFVKDCVSFTTTVSARFWLMDCRNVTEATRMATELYTHATHVPFMAKFVVFAKRVDPLEARLRVFCMTDDKEDKTLEHQEHFTEVAKSRDVEVLEGKTQYMEFAGNLVPVLKSGEQLQLPFRAFKENRVPFTARVKDPDAADMVGRVMFMSEPKVAKGEPPQTPICTLNILLPEKISPDAAHSELDLLELSKNYSFLRDGGISRPDTIHRATIRLTDIANLLDRDWEKLAEEINISPADVELIKMEHSDKPALQAAAMFKIWQAHGNKATGNTLEKALNKIGREDIVKQCIFNVELVTDDVEKAVARVRLDHPGFDSLKEELGPSRDSSLRRDGTLGDRKVKIDYEEPDRMRDSESIEDLRTVGNVPHKQTKQQHITINGTTVFNGTSTPIKDKYASEEKELVDDMADFIEHKCHTTDTMTKRIRDEEDDDNKNRQKIIEDANKLVTGVLQDAEKEKEKLAKEGWSGVYDDTSKEAEGAVGHIEGIIVKDIVGRGEESIEPLIIKQKKIQSPHGTIITTVTTTTKGDPKSGTVVSQTKTIKETITPGQVRITETKDPVTRSDDLSRGKVTLTKTIITLDSDVGDIEIPRAVDKPTAPMAAFDSNFEADRAIDTVRIQSGPASMSTKHQGATKTEVSKKGKDTTQKTKKNKLNDDTKDSTLEPTATGTEKGAYEDVYNVQSDDVKAEENKKKEKGGIFSGIFKGPKTKKGKKRNSKEVSIDSGDEDIKATKEFLEDTRKIADLARDSPRFEYPAFDPTNHLCICPPKLPEHEPTRDPIWATADFLYDSRRSAEAFVPETIHNTEEEELEIKPIDGVAITPESEMNPENKSETKPDTASTDDHKEKHSFFSGLFKSSKKHDSEADLPVLKAKKEVKGIAEKHEGDVQRSMSELKNQVENANDGLGKTTDEVDTAMAMTNKSIQDDIKHFKKTIHDDKNKIDDHLKHPTGEQKPLHTRVDFGGGEIEIESEHATRELNTDIKEATDEIKDKSGGFFGIFKSPKVKNRRSRSKDKDTPKDVSFDSGDEELRITTAAFLDDTRKAADRALPEPEKGGARNEKIDIEIKKFTVTVPEESDLPKDRLKGSSYDITVPKIATTTVITTKTITTTLPDAEPIHMTQPPKQKPTHGDKRKVEKRISGEFSDSADEGKSKGPSFFEKFKSPKLKSRKKSESRDRSTSAEPSFDSGDEELKNITSKFLEDTRKIADISGGFDKPVETCKDTIHTGEFRPPVTLERREIHAEKVDSQSKDDDSKDKGGIFGIFKSPKSHNRKRSKSREKSSSTDVSLDSGDEELRILTSKLLDDSRRIADIMEEHPYPSAPALETVGKRPEAAENIEKTIQPDEKPGFLSGILKSAKHVVGEVTDDVKEFWDETKEEAAEEKDNGGIELEKSIKVVEKINNEIVEIGKAASGKAVDETSTGVRSTLEDPVTVTTDIREKVEHKTIHDDEKGPSNMKEKTSKVSKDSNKTKKSVDKPVKKGIDTQKGRPVIDTKKTVESPTPAKRKTGKEPEKLQGKGSGLLSGIIKGAKHAVNEVSEDVKEFWDETKEEAKKEDQMQKEGPADVKKISPKKDSDATGDETSKQGVTSSSGPLKAIKGKAIQTTTTTTTVKSTRISPPKNGKAHEQTKKPVPQSSKDDSKTVKRKISDADKTGKSTAKAVKESIGEKVKGTKDTPGPVKTAKDTTVEIEKTVKASSTVKSKQNKEIPSEKPKPDKTNGHEKSKPVRQSPPKGSVDINLTKGISIQVKTDQKGAKSKAPGPPKTTVVAKDAIQNKGKDKNGKDKGSNLLSGIIKGTKHAADEVVEEVNQFLDDTQKEADAAKRRVSEELAADGHGGEKEVVPDTQSEKNYVSSAITESATDVVDFARAGGKEVTEDINAVEEQVLKDIKPIKEKLTDTVTVDISSTELPSDKVEKEVKRTKDKGKGFLFGIFKGSKHNTDGAVDIQDDIDDMKKEIEQDKEAKAFQGSKVTAECAADSVDDFLVKTKEEVSKEYEQLQHEAGKIKKSVNDTHDDVHVGVDAGKNIIHESEVSVSTIRNAFEQSSNAAIEATKKVLDDTVETKRTVTQEVKKELGNLEDEANDIAEDVATTVADNKDSLEKETLRVKDKTKGFFSGIFKGAKHASSETMEDVKDLPKSKIDIKVEGSDHKVSGHAPEAIRTPASNENIVTTSKDAVSSAINETEKIMKDAVEKTVDGTTQRIHTVKVALEKQADNFKADQKHVIDTVEESKETIEKEVEKAKDKTKGFFSSIFKGAKHTADEVAKDTKETIHDSQREIEDDLSKLSKQTKSRVDEITAKLTDELVDITTAGEAAISGASDAKTGKEVVVKFSDNVAKEKESIAEKAHKEIDSVTLDVEDIIRTSADVIQDSQDNMSREAGKAKEKTKGFFSGIFKSAKHTAEEISNDQDELLSETDRKVQETKQKVSHQISDIKLNVADTTRRATDEVVNAANSAKDDVTDVAKTIGDTTVCTADQTLRASKDTVNSVLNDVVDTAAVTREKVENETKILTEGITVAADDVANLSKESKDKSEKEAARGKEKSKSFFAGIFKGAKHAADEVVDDVKDFIHETEQEARNDEEKLLKHVSDTVETGQNFGEKATDKVVATAVAGKNATVTAITAANDAIADTAEQLSKTAQDAAKKTSDNIVETTNAVTAKLHKDEKSMKDGMIDASHDISDSVKEGKGKLEKDATKVKDKTKGFFSGIFKGAKNAVDDANADIGKSVKEGNVKLDREKEKVLEGVSKTTETIDDTAKKVEGTFVDNTSAGKVIFTDAVEGTNNALSRATNYVTEKSQDLVQKIGGLNEAKDSITANFKEGMDSIHGELKETTSEIVDSTAKGIEQVEEDALKTKDKTTELLSGIYEGAKNATDKATDNTKEFLDHIKNEVRQDRQTISKQLSEASKSLNDTGEEVKHAIVDISVAEKDSVIKGAEKVHEELPKSVEDASKTTQRIGKKVADSLTDTKDTVNKKARMNVENVKEKVEDFGHGVTELATKAEDTAEKEATKAKEKTKGFFSGIFKGAKHVAHGAVDEVKEFIHDTEEEAKHDVDTVSKHVSDTSIRATDAVEKVKDEVIDVTVAGQHAVTSPVKVTGEAVSSTRKNVVDVTKGNVKKIEHDIEESEKAISDEAKLKADSVKDYVQETKHKVEKEGVKAKDKSKGFFSGIFKGAKHAAEEVVDDVKEFMHDTEEDAKHEAKVFSKEISHTTEVISNTAITAKDKAVDTAAATKHAVSDNAKVIEDAVPTAIDRVSEVTKYDAEQIADNVQEIKDSVMEKQKKSSESAKAEMTHIAHAVTESAEEYKDKAQKDVTKAKDKTKGFLSGIFKGSKHTTDEISGTAKDLIDMSSKKNEGNERQSMKNVQGATTVDVEKKTKDPIVDTAFIVDTSGDVIPKITTTSLDKLEDSTVFAAMEECKNTVSDDGNKCLESLKEEVTHVTHTVADSAKRAKADVERDALKTKEKTKGFFSGILKGSKHAVDEASGSTKDFLDQTRKEIEQDKEILSKQLEETTLNISRAAGNVQDNAMKTMEDLSGTTTGISEKVVNDIGKVKKDVPTNIEGGVNKLEEKLQEVAHIVTTTAEKSEEDLAREATRAKENTKSFMSGIVDGAKHRTDEVIKDGNNSIDLTKTDIEKGGEKLKHEISSAVTTTADGIENIKNQIIKTAETGQDIADNAAQLTRDAIMGSAEKASDITKHTTENVIDTITSAKSAVTENTTKESEHLKNMAKDAATTVSSSAVETQDKVRKGKVKAKEKSKGFFSGIFKGAKDPINDRSESTEHVTDVVDMAGKDGVVDVAEKEVDDIVQAVTITVEETKEKLGKESMKAKEKNHGFFSGMFKGAKSTADDASGSTKDVIDRTCSKIEGNEHDVAVTISNTVTTISKKGNETRDTVAASIVAGKDAVGDAAEATSTTISKTTQDTAKNVVDYVVDTKKTITAELEKDIKGVKDDVKDGLDAVIGAADKNKDKAEKEVTKAKDKTKGFFSGILKGGKHATDEIVDDVKDFMRETKEEALEEEQRIRHAAGEAMKDTKSAINEATAEASEKIDRIKDISEDWKYEPPMANIENTLSEPKKADHTISDAIKDAQRKIDESIQKVEIEFDHGTRTVDRALKDEASVIRENIREVSDDIDAGKEQLEKKGKKSKDKAKGFLSGIFMGAKHSVEGAMDDVSEFLDETRQEADNEVVKVQRVSEEPALDKNVDVKAAKEVMTKNIPKATKDVPDTAKIITAESQQTLESGMSVIADVSKSTHEALSTASTRLQDAVGEDKKVASTTEVTSSELHRDAHVGKEGGTKVVEPISEPTRAIDPKVGDKTVQAKEKSKGFLSGIFKSAKHAMDEVAADIDEFKAKTRKEAEEEEKALKKDFEIAQKAVNDIKDDAVSNVLSAKDKVSNQISESAKHAQDTLATGQSELNKKLSTIDANLSQTGEVCAESVSKAIQDIQSTAQQADDTTHKVTKAFDNELSRDAGVVNKAVSDSAHTVVDYVEGTKDKLKAGVETSTNKAQTFISDVIESGKHEADETAHRTQEFIDKSEKVFEENKQAAVKSIVDLHKKTADEFDSAKDNAVQQLSLASHSLANATKDKSKELGRDISEIEDDIHSTIKKASDLAQEEKQHLAEATRKAHDTVHSQIQNVKAEVQESIDKVAKEAPKISGQIVNDLSDKKDKVSGSAQLVVDSIDVAEMELAQRKEKTKEKGEGFFSSIFKHGKHTTDGGIADEIKDEVKDRKSTVKTDIPTTSVRVSEEISETKGIDAFSTDGSEKSPKEHKGKQIGFFSGIVKGAKHALEGVTDDVKEFWDETKEEAQEENEQTKHKLEQIEESVKHHVDNVEQDIKMDVDDHLTLEDLEVDSLKVETEEATKMDKDKHKSGAIFGILRRDKHDKNANDERMNIEKVVIDEAKTASNASKSMQDMKDDAKALEGTASDQSKLVSDVAATTSDDLNHDAKKTKDKSSNFFSGVLKGAKHAIGEVSDDVKEFWDDSTQLAKEEDEKTQKDIKKIVKEVEGQKDTVVADSVKRQKELEADVATEVERIRQTQEASTLMPTSLASTSSPIQDHHAATLTFLDDARETARRTGDIMPSAPIEIDSSPEEKKPKGKSKNVISSMIKGTKKATEKFWEDTKPEFTHESGSYDVSSPQRKSDEKRDKSIGAEVTLESFGPISSIPQKIDAANDFDREGREVRVVTFVERELDNSNRAMGIGHLEPHARQTVTTIVTKSSMRTTMSTPPPSPDELGDSRIKDVTEEAERRAQTLAVQAQDLEKSESDFMQQSEPSYVETTTTEIDPETNESITRTTRVLTTSSTTTTTGAAAGSDELRDSMQKIVDQFMTEERRGQ